MENYHNYSSVDLDFIRDGTTILIIDKNKTYNNCSKVTSSTKADKIEQMLRPLILSNKVTIQDIISQEDNIKESCLYELGVKFQLKFHISQPRYQDRKKVESVIKAYNINKGNLREYKDQYKSNNVKLEDRKVTCDIPIRVNNKTIIYVKEENIFNKKYIRLVGSFNQLLKRVIMQKNLQDKW